MKTGDYTKMELGLIYGMGIGAIVFLLMLALTGEIMWVLAMGAGIALGAGFGATFDQKR